MATTVPTTTSAGTLAVPLEKIHVASNVRDIDLEHVDALAGSIALQGLLVPVLLAPAQADIAEHGFDYELVAGYHRYAAVSKLQHSAIDAVVRERDQDSDGAEVAAARATENVTSCRRRHEVINADHVVMPIRLVNPFAVGASDAAGRHDVSVGRPMSGRDWRRRLDTAHGVVTVVLLARSVCE